MKKLYTLLSAAILSVGLVSAATLNTKNFKHVDIKAFDGKIEMPSAEMRVNPLENSVSKLKNVSTRISDPNAQESPFAGKYVTFVTYDGDLDESQVEDTRQYYTYYDANIVADGNDYIAKGLFGGNVDVKMTKSTVASGTSTVTVLTVPAGSTIYKDDEIEVKMYLYGNLNDDGKEYFFTAADIEFIALESNGSKMIVSYVGSYLGVGGVALLYETSEGTNGIKLYNPQLQSSDAVMTSSVYDEDTNSYVAENDNVLFGFTDKNYSTLVFYNFGASEYPIYGTFDSKYTTLTFKDQLYTESYDSSYNILEFYIKSDNSATDNTVVATLGADEYNRTTFNFGSWGAYSGNYYYIEAKSSVITYDYNLFGEEVGGITNVIADNDSNAPVEYYNLQGVRVANPEAGQLVIRRQGKNVSKIVVR